jgi:glycosyltransferase involved in cell wall biosynthesis
VIPVPFELPVSLGSLNGRLNEKPMGTFVVGIFARLNRVKGIHVLIKAVARLRLENLPVHLLVFGERSSIDPRYADELEMMVEAGGLRECVTFRGFTSEVIDAMRQCDVIVSCSLPRFGGPESFGRTVVEAWVAGVPVIATAVGGPAESVEHGRNGILVPAEDPIALAQSIQLLIENRELASRIANGGRESLPKYDSHHVAKLFGDALADCVHKGFGDL